MTEAALDLAAKEDHGTRERDEEERPFSVVIPTERQRDEHGRHRGEEHNHKRNDAHEFERSVPAYVPVTEPFRNGRAADDPEDRERSGHRSFDRLPTKQKDRREQEDEQCGCELPEANCHEIAIGRSAVVTLGIRLRPA